MKEVAAGGHPNHYSALADGQQEHGVVENLLAIWTSDASPAHLDLLGEHMHQTGSEPTGLVGDRVVWP